jgi:predicted DNA-binding transcriptional regulator AlpA
MNDVAFDGVAPEELAGLDEIAQLLGVSKISAKRYASRGDFPEPVGRLAGGRVWRRVDVRAWADRTLPLPAGRPRRVAGDR